MTGGRWQGSDDLVSETIHATAVELHGAGVLILGPPGSGKSDLALRLIDRGARLIADDRVAFAERGGDLRLSPPSTLAGLIEVRGIGIVRMPFVADVPARLVVELGEPERMPEPASLPIGGQRLKSIRLLPFEASAPYKVELAMAHVPFDG